jgi:hypothetical protein
MHYIWRRLWRLPVLIGAGALFASGARATVPDSSGDEAHSAGDARHRGGEVFLKLENDNIYFSQDAGRSYQELELATTPETTRLKRLLERGAEASGDLGVKVSPTLVADGAGGLQWARPQSVRATDSSDDAHKVTTRTTSAITDKEHRPAVPSGTAQAKPE